MKKLETSIAPKAKEMGDQSGDDSSTPERDWSKASISEIMAYTLMISVGLAGMKSSNEETAMMAIAIMAVIVFVGTLKVVYMFLGKTGVFVAAAIFVIALCLWERYMSDSYDVLRVLFNAQSG